MRYGISGYLFAAIACGLVTLLAWVVSPWLSAVNLVMLFLLVVFLTALYLGRRPALMAAFLSVALFDFFFVQPHFSFAVADAQYLVTFVVMLAVALVTGQLAARVARQAEEATARAADTRALYEMARELAGAMSVPQVEDSTQRFLAKNLDAQARLILPDGQENHGTDSGRRPDAGHDITLSLPLLTPMCSRGVLQVRLAATPAPMQRALLEAVASLVAIAVERLHYVEVAQSVETRMAEERLRHSVLASLSHDLRTPLTALLGLADTLLLPIDAPTHQETAQALRDQARALTRMVNNLLDLARLSSGNVVLRREWQPLEEVAGAAIKTLGVALHGHAVRVVLPPDLPLLSFDAILLERVMANLLDNAAKHAPPGTTILLSARRAEASVEVSVCDSGPGFPSGVDLTEPFVKGTSESATPGIGLGLAICKTILEAHAGRISLENPPEGGACVRFTLPLGTPPLITEEA